MAIFEFAENGRQGFVEFVTNKPSPQNFDFILDGGQAHYNYSICSSSFRDLNCTHIEITYEFWWLSLLYQRFIRCIYAVSESQEFVVPSAVVSELFSFAFTFTFSADQSSFRVPFDIIDDVIGLEAPEIYMGNISLSPQAEMAGYILGALTQATLQLSGGWRWYEYRSCNYIVTHMHMFLCGEIVCLTIRAMQNINVIPFSFSKQLCFWVLGNKSIEL